MHRTTSTDPGAPTGGSISRRNFIRMGAILGILLPPIGCGNDGDGEPVDADDRPTAGDADGRSVIVVGAGAAGLTAAHLLARAGVDVRVLEASTTHGGRMRRTLDFVDFPIPLGAEWLHDDADVLRHIADGHVDVELVGYGPDDTVGYYDGELTIERIDDDDNDLKFVGSSWLDFFDEHVVPGITDRLEFDTQIVRIDSSGDRLAITDERGDITQADAVIVTVPVTILRHRDITFVPDLADNKWAAIDDVQVWGGIKVFVEFDERFYPTFIEFPDSNTAAGQRLYYDAAHGQDSDAHVLGLFAVGEPAEPYQGLDSDALRDHILTELDEIFDGAASRGYRRHVAQDWSAEPFVRQAYVADEADWQVVRTLGEPADDRVLFAGDAYTDGEDWSAVHVAANSARVAVDRLLSYL
jgi:monoamine oxidase